MSLSRDDALGLADWYAWDADEGDQGWLLTYVDVLSVILAMLLVLLARLGPFDTPQTRLPPDDSSVVAATAVPPSAPGAFEEPAPTILRSVAQPVAAPVPEPDARDNRWMAPEPLLPMFPVGSPEPILPVPEPALIPLANLATTETLTEFDRDDRGVTLKIPDVVLFDSARAELKPTARPVLDRVAQALSGLGEVDIIVQGHTDDRPVQGGAFESNWALAAARANAVTAFLLERGFPAARLSSVSFADTRPVADNRSEAGRARNRRVEIRAEFAGQRPPPGIQPEHVPDSRPTLAAD